MIMCPCWCICFMKCLLPLCLLLHLLLNLLLLCLLLLFLLLLLLLLLAVCSILCFAAMMASTIRPDSSPMAMTTRSWSTPTFHDWTADWDTDCTQAAPPRYTIGNSDLGSGKYRDRTTFLDYHVKNKKWVPGPGTHRRLRDSDPEPPKETGWNDKTYSLGRARDRSVPKIFSRSIRAASLTDLKKEKKMLLPTSFLTPGPGAYTAYTSFGAPSGPTRKRYFATSKANTMGQSRPVEKFLRHSER